ncbi:MAG: caspase family protein [Rhodoplanes sp.]|uniref:caspase family protein n=1 Tax=Rhodoplanes sp. TaxID=1968906 RepID=UPI0017F16518|nr:caspase family protein [Rhodoplanes sp.]NVO12488.1 caspase family protein [Rhodoplanes sp.]
MRTVKFAGAAALAFVSLTLVSAEIIRTAVGQQFEPGTEMGTRLALAPSRGNAGTDERRVAARGGSPEQAAPATGAAAPVAVASTAETAVAGPLLALVIGNGAYPDGEAPLAAPINDARAVAGELRTRGFDVELGENLSKQAMERAIQRFEAKITPGATALVYFSGHGLQVGRENYLVPVSAQIWRPEDVRRDGVGLEPLVAEMNTRGAVRKLVIVDAARRNPFERRLRGFSSGLAPIAGPEGTLVLYAVAPGKVADQENGDTSVFARELIAQIRAPGLTVEEVFNRTRVTVARATGGTQVPAVFSAMTDDFSFAQASEPGPTRQSAR